MRQRPKAGVRNVTHFVGGGDWSYTSGVGGGNEFRWVRSLVTLFADDVLEKWEFHAESDLEWFLYCIGMTFEILEEFGMTVNPGEARREESGLSNGHAE